MQSRKLLSQFLAPCISVYFVGSGSARGKAYFNMQHQVAQHESMHGCAVSEFEGRNSRRRTLSAAVRARSIFASKSTSTSIAGHYTLTTSRILCMQQQHHYMFK
jgi:hypothetical protein